MHIHTFPLTWSSWWTFQCSSHYPVSDICMYTVYVSLQWSIWWSKGQVSKCLELGLVTADVEGTTSKSICSLIGGEVMQIPLTLDDLKASVSCYG